MKVTTKLPVLVRGLPINNNGPRNIFVSWNSEWNIPEVSSSETELAFESFDAVKPIFNEDDILKRYPIRHERTESYTIAISYAGSLYRRVSRDDEDISTMFSQSFPRGYDNEWTLGAGSDISCVYPHLSTETERGARPTSLPVFSQLHWQMLCSSTRDMGMMHLEIWPQYISSAPSLAGKYQSRDYVTFEEILPKLVAYRHEQLEECFDIHTAHMRNFLVVDGELWMRTRPPVYRVEQCVDGGERTSVAVSLVFAPDGHDMKLPRAYFSLGAREEAFKFANDLCDVLGKRPVTRFTYEGRRRIPFTSPGVRGTVLDFTSRHLVHDSTLAEYPCHEEELRRVSFGLAVETHRFLARHPSWKAKFGTDAVDGVVASFSEVTDTNYLLGSYGDASDHLESNLAVWKKARRAHSAYEFDQVDMADLVIDRALRYEGNKPIYLQAAQQPTMERPGI